jgi:hypothetical protein
VAHTTQTSEPYGSWRRPPPRAIVPAEMWFGRRVPDSVTAISMMRSYLTDDQLLVRWRVKGDTTIHEMPFEQTDEGVTAALAAMKLTC